MIIASDMDGVIANIFVEFEIRLKKDFDIQKPWTEWTTHYIAKEFEGIVPESWVDEQLGDPTFFLNAKPYESAWYMLNKWFMAGHDIYITTCRGHGDFYSDETLQITERWLDEWEINYNQILGNLTRLEKWKTCEAIGADLLIEDDPHEILVASQHLPAYMVAYPYNSNYDIGAGIRINSLYELDDIVMNKKEVAQ